MVVYIVVTAMERQTQISTLIPRLLTIHSELDYPCMHVDLECVDRLHVCVSVHTIIL